MVVTIDEIERLKKGDYIEASGFYYKVIKINTKSKTLILTEPFSYGEKAIGKWASNYNNNISKIDHQNWDIIKKNAPGAKGLEKKVK